MKHTPFILLIIALLALSACAPVAQQPAPAPSAPASAAPAETPSAPFVDYSLQQETRDKVTANMKSTTKYSLSESYIKLMPGEHHTFGIAFTNRVAEKDNFLVSVSFKRAYDKSGNSIDAATEAQIATWLAHNDFSVTPLDINQQSLQPIVIEAANFADGSTPPKGSYEFNVEVLYQNGLFSPTDEYSGRLPVVVQVI